MPFAPACATLLTAFLTAWSLSGCLPWMFLTAFWMAFHFIFCFFLMYSSFQNKRQAPNNNSNNNKIVSGCVVLA